ncbi:hypothetical protein ACJIZ3_002617 [Penstemon smallii]|uniref:Uncharacterized protein n=1 Tax=Penstemon smallii TaxID=265156 RepID=A0ABD3U6X3_9LAMI
MNSNVSNPILALFPVQLKSTTCPATSPSVPIALANSPTAASTLFGATPLVAVAMNSNAKASKESAANTATSSPNTLWFVGFPRRRSSLSIQGKSSWIKDMAAMHNMGRTLFPPANNEYLIASWIVGGFFTETASSRALLMKFAFSVT